MSWNEALSPVDPGREGTGVKVLCWPGPGAAGGAAHSRASGEGGAREGSAEQGEQNYLGLGAREKTETPNRQVERRKGLV